MVVATAGSGYLTAPTIAFTGGAGASAAATATLSSEAAVSQVFRAIVPIADCVISEITFAGQVNGVNYHEDSKIIGKTLTKGITYPIFGSSIKLSSGSAIILLR